MKLLLNIFILIIILSFFCTLAITESKSGAAKPECTIVFKYPKIEENSIILIDDIISHCLKKQGIEEGNFVFKTCKNEKYVSILKNGAKPDDSRSYSVPKKISILELQQSLEHVSAFKNINIYKSWLGNIYVNIQFRNPVARILSVDGKPMYLDDAGDFFPTSNKYAFKVLTIAHDRFFTNNGTIKKLECDYCNKNSITRLDRKHTKAGTPSSFATSIFKPILNKSVFARAKESSEFSYNEHAGNCNRKLLKLLVRISCDKFLQEQISHMFIDSKGNIKLYTQVSKQTVEFGLPTYFEEKLKKLKILYKQILPAAGWNTYKRVNIEFENQIICE